jgi:hypothetical protein
MMMPAAEIDRVAEPSLRGDDDALLGEHRKRAWVIIRKQVPMPARR